MADCGEPGVWGLGGVEESADEDCLNDMRGNGAAIGISAFEALLLVLPPFALPSVG